MYKIISSLIIILATCSSVFAANSQPEKSLYLDKTKNSSAETGNRRPILISPIVGLRYDVIQWSIPGINVSKLSELTWKNKIAEVGIEVLTEPMHNDLNFLGAVKYGKILNDSQSQDSDLDKFGEFSKTFSKVKGNTFDISAAIGKSQNMASKTSFVTYYFGFDYNYSSFENFGLNYKINRERHSLIQKPLGQLSPNTELVATYKYHNYAPWVGAKLNYKLNDKLSFSPFLKAYLFVYNAEADWVLRNDFRHDPSFKHIATGAGFSLDAELLYKVANHLDIHANIGVKKLTMLKGASTTYFSDSTVTSFPLKDLTMLTNTLNIGARYKF